MAELQHINSTARQQANSKLVEVFPDTVMCVSICVHPT